MVGRFYVKASGRLALFTVPEFRQEKCTYQVPTYDSIKGLLESIYWKPTIIWVPERLRVMMPIRTHSIMTNALDENRKRKQVIQTYLHDVCYHIQARMEWNPDPKYAADQNPGKHLDITRRSIEKGGRLDTFLGTRECQCVVAPLLDLMDGRGTYDDSGDLYLGTMLHGIDYPTVKGGKHVRRLWRDAVMKDGIIKFPDPWNPQEDRLVRDELEGRH